jgi:histidine triad (HIT) family protein
METEPAKSTAHTADSDCLFCKILAGDIPAEVVLETDTTYAFRDINPTAPTHVLVIPREHVAHAGEVTPEHGAVLADMLVTARQVAEADGIAERGYRLVFNVGRDAGNTVPHLHLHVIGGRGMAWPPG